MPRCSPECSSEDHVENRVDEEVIRLRDFQPLKADGVDYTGTDHPRYDRIEKEKSAWVASPGWADIIAGKCKCIQCEYARFKHNVKQMVEKEKLKAKDSQIRKKSNVDTAANNFPRWQINI